jgi:hypothetical protein
MPTVAQTASLHVDAIDDAARWYDPERVPDAFADLDRRVIRRAFKLAGGDWRRVVRDVDTDALTILNAVSW